VTVKLLSKAVVTRLGKETRGTQAASPTPPMLNVKNDAFQPSEYPPGVTTRN
jgi:hypothetical protein